jgi:DME family drug/metabolite transporter
MSRPAIAPTRRGLLEVAAAASLWGTWSLFLRPAGLAATVTAPLVIALVGLFVWPMARREPPAPLAARTALLLVSSAVLEALNVVTFFGAMSVTTNAVAVLTHYLAPVWVALLAPWIDRQRVPFARVAAVLAVAGLTLVLRPWSAGLDPRTLLGAALGATSAVAYAGNVFVLRRLVTTMGVARAQRARSLLAAAMLAPGVLMGPSPPPQLGPYAWVAVGALLPGALAGLLFARGLARIGAARASVLTYLEPLVSVAIGVVIWREPATRWTAMGCAMVIVAGLVVTRATPRRPRGTHA